MEFIPRGLFDVAGNARTELGERIGENRSPGVHLSECVGDMRAAGGLPGGIPGEQDRIRMQLGFLFEHAIELVIQGIPVGLAMEHAYKRWMLQVRVDVVTQITGCKDRVHMTPDGLDCNEGLIESYKYTYKSMRKAESQVEFEENFWPWVVSEKAYCYGWGVDTVRFYVCWDRGDYSFKPGRGGPQVQVYDCVFTEEELVGNWAAVLKYRDVREARTAEETMTEEEVFKGFRDKEE